QLAVADLDDALDAQRLPAQVFAGVPTTLHAGAVFVLGHGGSPLSPRVVVEGIHAQRGKLVDQLPPLCHGERPGDGAGAESAALRQAEPEGADDRAGLVPAETDDGTVGGAFVLDFEHEPLVRLVGQAALLGDDPVEPGALENRKPAAGELDVGGY